MSRHLMARFRHLHAAVRYVWQHGRPLGWSQWATTEPTWWGTPGVDVDPSLNDAGDHVSAIVHHGEQRYGLEVMPNHYSKNGKGGWTWGIHQHHNHNISLWDDPTIEDWHKGEWLNWISPGEWDHPEGSPAEYYGHADTQIEAMDAAQNNWEAHKAHVDAQNPIRGGDYDINQIMREQGF